MTREIEILTSLKDRFEDVVEEGLLGVDTDAVDALDSNKEIVEALEVAIKALAEREPCDMCDYATNGGCQYDDIAETIPTEGKPCDAISRMRVFSAIHNTHLPKKYEEPLWNKILALPSATPKPKTGRWTNGDPICPCCGEDKFKDLDADLWADWQPKYCPNCGAKMESEGAV